MSSFSLFSNTLLYLLGAYDNASGYLNNSPLRPNLDFLYFNLERRKEQLLHQILHCFTDRVR